MIEIFEGRLGGGKTYSAVYRGMCHFLRGGTVCTNIDLNWDGCCKYARDRFGLELERDQFIYLSDEQIPAFHKHTPSGTGELPVLVIIDEAPLNFDSRDFAQNYKDNREVYTFSRQSRKTDTDLILIAQDATDLDKKLRNLSQYTWRFRDLSKWKIPGLGMKFPFNWILCVQMDYDGKTMLDKNFIPKDKGIFRCYNTKSLLRRFERLEGIQTKRTLKRVKRPFPVKPILGGVLAVDAVLIAAAFFIR